MKYVDEARETINELQEFSKEQLKIKYPLFDLDSEINRLFLTIRVGINEYLARDFSEEEKEINNFIQCKYCEILRSTTKYSNDDQFDFNFDKNKPSGYLNAWDLFYDFRDVRFMSKSRLLESYTLDIATMTLDNDYILEVANIIKTLPKDLVKIKNVADWCANNGNCCDLINLLEDRGELLEIKETREIADTIYINHQLLDVIKDYKLNSYIPTYYKDR